MTNKLTPNEDPNQPKIFSRNEVTDVVGYSLLVADISTMMNVIAENLEMLEELTDSPLKKSIQTKLATLTERGVDILDETYGALLEMSSQKANLEEQQLQEKGTSKDDSATETLP